MSEPERLLDTQAQEVNNGRMYAHMSKETYEKMKGVILTTAKDETRILDKTIIIRDWVPKDRLIIASAILPEENTKDVREMILDMAPEA